MSGYYKYFIVLIFFVLPIISIYGYNDNLINSRTELTRIEVSGPQSGVWESGNLYQVIDNISVEEDDMLIIEPGVRIEFNSLCGLTVYGCLISQGTVEDSIIFSSWSPLPTNFDWYSIQFSGASSSESIISYSVIEWCIVGIKCEDQSSPSIENNYIHDTQCGIEAENECSPVILNNTLYNNNPEGIYCHSSSFSEIRGNRISNSEFGIRCTYNSQPVIAYNILANNYRGIEYYGRTATIYNNTFANNDRRIHSVGQIELTLINNIFYGNNTGMFEGDYSTLNSEYNCFYQNLEDFVGYTEFFGVLDSFNGNGNPCDQYYNIFANPQFIDPEASDFGLDVSSWCIDAGDPDEIYNDPDNTIADIGALYYQQYEPDIFAEFQAHPQTGSAPLTVVFTNMSTGNVNYCLWNFGDGSTSNILSPSHQYSEPGLFTVSLTVYGTNQQNTETKPDYISVGLPVVNIYGSQNGVWTSDHIYRIVNDVEIISGSTLSIEPGVRIEFMGYYQFNISGTLSACGSDTEPVLIVSGSDNVNAGDWNRIRFQGIESSNSEISHCHISNSYMGITCEDHASPEVHHNSIYDNVVGVMCQQNCSPLIYNNTLVSNMYYGIYCTSGEPLIYNNIFAENSTALNSNILLSDFGYNLFWFNSDDYSGIIPPEFAQLTHENNNGELCDQYYNIFLDPQYVNSNDNNYNLLPGSPAIDAGNPEVVYNDPDDTINDIGAYYYPHVINNEDYIKESISSHLKGNYPNPFNPETTILFNLSSDAEVEIYIYNLEGQQVKKLKKKQFRVGDHAIRWNGEDDRGNSVSSGMYFYTLNLNGIREDVKKCLLIK